MAEKRRIVLNHILNCRDLGGYPSVNGTTEFRRFFRCGVTDTPDDSEISTLEKMGVKTVIDLRGDYESQDILTHFERIKGADVHHVSLFEINVADTNVMNMTLAQSYEFIIDNYKDNVKKVLEIIANAQEGIILYHCFFGKDRTGIMSMLLLHIAGVPLEDIIADYQQSYTYLLPYITAHAGTLWNVDNTMHYSLPETMATLIDYINTKYGSVMQYIADTGISEDNILKIKKKFFTKS